MQTVSQIIAELHRLYDAATMAELTWLPATWWVLIWMMVSTAILFGALKLAVRR